MKVRMYKTVMQGDGHGVCVREASSSFVYDGRRRFSDPESVFEFCVKQMDINSLTEEYVYCICLNSKNRMTGIFEISHGTVNASLVQPREVFQKLLLFNTVGFIMVHNHPSGDPTPSEADFSITKRIKKCSDMLGIAFHDHVVIGNGSYYSFNKKGAM